MKKSIAHQYLCLFVNAHQDICNYIMENITEKNGIIKLKKFTWKIVLDSTTLDLKVKPTDTISEMSLEIYIPNFRGNIKEYENIVSEKVFIIFLNQLQLENVIYKIYEAGYPHEDFADRPEYNVKYSTNFGNAYSLFLKMAVSDLENKDAKLDIKFNNNLCFSHSEFKGYASIIKLDVIDTIEREDVIK